MTDSVEDGTEGGYTAYPAGHEGAMRDYIRRLERRNEQIYTIGEMAGLPTGTRIATNDGKLLFLAEMFGSQHWVDRTGQLYSPLVSWLPVIVLPPAVRNEQD